MWCEPALPKPLGQMLVDEVVVIQMRIGPANAVDSLRLARGEVFPRVQAPPALQETLAPHDFVDSRETAVESMGRVKDRRQWVGLRTTQHALDLVGPPCDNAVSGRRPAGNREAGHVEDACELENGLRGGVRLGGAVRAGAG